MAACKNISDIYFLPLTSHFVYIQRTHKDHYLMVSPAPGVGADWVLAAGDESEFCQYPGGRPDTSTPLTRTRGVSNVVITRYLL